MRTVENNIKRLNSFKQLKRNWDSYGAEPVPEYVIDKAICIISKLSIQPFVVPTANLSIQFEWEEGENYLEIEISETEITKYCVLQREIQEKTEEEFVVQYEEIPEIVNQFYKIK